MQTMESKKTENILILLFCILPTWKTTFIN